jgi:hypothetical protein
MKPDLPTLSTFALSELIYARGTVEKGVKRTPADPPRQTAWQPVEEDIR